jgi:hypothetical protein
MILSVTATIVHSFIVVVVPSKEGSLGRKVNHIISPRITTLLSSSVPNSDGSGDIVEWSDFDDFVGDYVTSNNSTENTNLDNILSNNDINTNDTSSITSVANILSTSQPNNKDWTGVQARLFSLGQDVMVTDYVGNIPTSDKSFNPIPLTNPNPNVPARPVVLSFESFEGNGLDGWEGPYGVGD